MVSRHTIQMCDDCIEMNQSEYVENMLNWFGMTECETRSTERLHTIKDILTKPASKARLIKFAPIRGY